MVSFHGTVVYDESIKGAVKIKPIYECRCDGRLQTKRFTLSHTGLVVELEHLKIKTRLTNEKFASVKGECAIVYCDHVNAKPKSQIFFFFWKKDPGSVSSRKGFPWRRA